MMTHSTTHRLAGLLLLLVLAAPCCGGNEYCSESFRFNAPVPDMRLAPGDTTSYELLGNVWALVTTCDDGTQSERFPEAFVASEDPEVATVALLPSAHGEPSRVHVRARTPGETTVVVRIRFEHDCEDELDATHFTVTVAP